MGRKLDGFDIDLEFDGDGGVASISYCDGEGCGHSTELHKDTTLGEVAQYHLRHYSQGHDMRPPKKCKETIEDTRLGQVLRCTVGADTHHYTHKFELTKGK
jgi:hypothetical protein